MDDEKQEQHEAGIVHAPCERRPFSEEQARQAAADWIYINIDSPSQV